MARACSLILLILLLFLAGCSTPQDVDTFEPAQPEFMELSE
ncbi:hypothetical protein [Ruficoccus amylovorans]|nr:hypothetical protein [Ruficoccus amylovorans]